MTTRQPPRLALELLCRRLGPDEPLIGDLLEDFAVGRSRLWFWRQAIAAIFLHPAGRPAARNGSAWQNRPRRVSTHSSFPPRPAGGST